MWYYGGIMKRTTVMLPEELRARAMRRARNLGLSLGEFIRRAMEALLEDKGGGADEDPLLRDEATYDGHVPGDLAARHDEYLYDRPTRRK
jgi:Arc/MetJ-type ribon-helix-helix transcriptional regulator